MEKNKKIKILLYELFFVILVIAFDQITKLLIYHPIENSGKDIILFENILRFTSEKNYGASFGIFQGYVSILTIISTISLLGFIIFGVCSVKEQNKWYRIGLVLVVAGGIGNVIDRIVFGYVRDFVYFELINFAVFNFADSALTIGTAFLIIYLLFYYDKKEDKTKVKEGILTDKITDKITDNLTQVKTEKTTEDKTKEEIKDE